jgi:hypothetical protein
MRHCIIHRRIALTCSRPGVPHTAPYPSDAFKLEGLLHSLESIDVRSGTFTAASHCKPASIVNQQEALRAPTEHPSGYVDVPQSIPVPHPPFGRLEQALHNSMAVTDPMEGGGAQEHEELAVASCGVVLPRNDEMQYRLLRLENGLRVILISDPEADKAAAAMDVSAMAVAAAIQCCTLASSCCTQIHAHGHLHLLLHAGERRLHL